MSVVSVTELSEFEGLLRTAPFVFVDFYADWCGPCRMVAPLVETLAKGNPAVKFVKVNVDHAQELTRRYGISAMPTFLAFANGNKIGEVMGADKGGIERLVASLK